MLLDRLNTAREQLTKAAAEYPLSHELDEFTRHVLEAVAEIDAARMVLEMKAKEGRK